MGFSISWVAVENGDEQEILELLKMEKNDESSEVPDAPMSMLKMNNSWVVIVQDHGGNFISEDIALLTKLSENRHVIAGYAEEHVMCSASYGWKQGKKIWTIEHDLTKGATHIYTEGTLPDCFSASLAQIKERSDEDGDGCDYYFDLPHMVSTNITGFSHDNDPDAADDEPFKTIVPRKAEPKKSFFGKLFSQH